MVRLSAVPVICQLTGGLLQELLGQERLGHLHWVIRGLACDDALHHLIVGLAVYCQRQVFQLGVNQPAVVEADPEEVENDTLRSVLEVLDAGEPAELRHRVLEITRHCQTTTGTLPHIDIQSSQQLGQNVDGVVDIVVEVRSGVARVVPRVEEEVGEELQQLLG